MVCECMKDDLIAAFAGIESPHSQKANGKVAKKGGRKTEAFKIGGRGRKETVEVSVTQGPVDRKRQEDNGCSGEERVCRN